MESKTVTLAARLTDDEAPRAALTATFRRRDDRFRHRVCLLAGESEYPLLESIEGTDQQPWPPSPPLQEAMLQTDRVANSPLLLVGMAGIGHWSGSVEAVSGQEECRISFDIACRLPGPPQHLGSAYRQTNPAVAGDEGVPALLWQAPNGLQCHLFPVALDAMAAADDLANDADASGLHDDGSPWTESKSAARSCDLTAHADQLLLEPRVTASTWPSTIRWKYAVRLRLLDRP